MPTTVSSLSVRCAAFAEGGEIPMKHTCEGADVSPALEWSGVPPGAKSLALVVEDPDAPDPKAPKRTWVHWLLYDLTPAVTGLPEGVSRDALPPGTRQGVNDWKRTGWAGPCPPIGRHRYFIHLYALDVVLGDLGTPTQARLQEAMKGHIVAQGQTMGTYQKKKR